MKLAHQDVVQTIAIVIAYEGRRVGGPLNIDWFASSRSADAGATPESDFVARVMDCVTDQPARAELASEPAVMGEMECDEHSTLRAGRSVLAAAALLFGISLFHMNAVQALPEVFRTTILLVNVDGLGYDEAAGVLGVPPGTVRSRMKRGRTLLQKALWEQARDAGLAPIGKDQP